MGIMDLVRKWKEKNSAKGEKFKEMEEDYRLQKMLEERQKSSEQRELEAYYKRKEQEQYKKAVDKLHQQQTKEAWKGKSILKSEHNILKEDKKILANDRPILMQRSMFLDNKTNSPLTKQELFFKF
jgi:hypothetical protein